MASELLDRILAEIKAAMKAREAEKLTALRSVHAQIKDAGTNAGKEESDDLVLSVLARAIKQRKDSVEQYRDGGRDDLAEREEREIEWLQAFQPPQLGEGEVEEIVGQAIAESGATTPRDMGAVMKIVMPKLKGRADGKLVNNTVKRLLGA
jgi:uncharacterized protein YqeY